MRLALDFYEVNAMSKNTLLHDGIDDSDLEKTKTEINDRNDIDYICPEIIEADNLLNGYYPGRAEFLKRQA